MSISDKSSADVITTSSERHGSNLETASTHDAFTTSCKADSFFRDPLNDDAIVTSQGQSAPTNGVPFAMPEPNVSNSEVSKPGDPTEITRRDKKVMYKITLQPRLSDSNPGPSMPPQYLELFERLQPKIVAQGYTSEAESLLTLNRCLRPKKESAASSPAGSPRGQTPAPLRVIGGRRMPPESFVKEREMAPWASRKYTAVTMPRASPNGAEGPGTDAGRRRRPSLEEGLGTAAVAAKGPFSVRPRSLGGTMRERQILSTRIRSLPPPPSRGNLDCREDEFSGFGSGRRVQLGPSSTSYRAYSQRVFQNARKLNCFDESDDRRTQHGRSLSFDWSSAATEGEEQEGFGQSPSSTAAVSFFHSPRYLSHVTSPESEDERSFLKDPAVEGFDKSHKTAFESENKDRSTRHAIGNDTEQVTDAISGIDALFRALALSASHYRSADPETMDAKPSTDRVLNSGSTDRHNSVAAAPTMENKHVIRNWTEAPIPATELDRNAQDSAGQDHDENGSETEKFVSTVTILLQRPTQRKNDFRTPVNANRCTMKLHSLHELRKIAEQSDIFSD